MASVFDVGELPKSKELGLLASLANTCTKYLAINV